MKPWGPFDFVKPVQSSHLITPFLFLPLWVLLLFLNMPNVLLSSFPLFYSLQCLFFFPRPLFSCASRNLQKYLVFLQPSVFDHHSTWWIFFQRWTPFPHSGREPPLQCTATLWHWKGGSLAHWGSTGRGLHCHKPSWPNPLERHRRAASPIHFLIGDSERERILSWQKTNHVLSCVKS